MESLQRPRALRKPFVASIVVTDLASERKMSAYTDNLSVQGCFVPTATPFNPGVKVQVTIIHGGVKVVGSGRVVAVRAEGMSIAFTKIEQRDQSILEKWISDLRGN